MNSSARAKIIVRRALHRAGFDLVRSLDADDLLRRRMELLQRHQISLVFDIGANAGQYASTMRALGYHGRIVSFEPAAEAFHMLVGAVGRDPGWTAVNCALGDRDGQATLHISGNSQSSSVLAMLPSHLASDPASCYVGDETVRMTTLAQQIEQHMRPKDRLFVKIDTQGSELQVLAGAGDGLTRVIGLQLELSLVPLYEDQALIEEVISFVRALGYILVSIEPDFYNPGTGELLQADGIFFRPGDTATPNQQAAGT